MARVDDVVYSYIHLDRIEALDLKTRQLIQEAIRYGFQQGESFGRYVKYAEETEDKMICEVFQKTEPKKLQKVVRTDYEYRPRDLEEALADGWTVAHITQMGMGRSKIESILEKTEILGNSETVKNPEE